MIRVHSVLEYKPYLPFRNVHTISAYALNWTVDGMYILDL